MKHIMLNHKVSENEFRYCLFNEEKRIRSEANLNPEEAKVLDYKKVSPVSALKKGFFRFDPVPIRKI